MITLSDEKILDLIDLLVKRGRFWVIKNYMDSGYTIRTSIELYMEKYPDTK